MVFALESDKVVGGVIDRMRVHLKEPLSRSLLFNYSLCVVVGGLGRNRFIIVLLNHRQERSGGSRGWLRISIFVLHDNLFILLRMHYSLGNQYYWPLLLLPTVFFAH